MRGHNVVVLSGNIGGNIVISETKDKRSACSFGVASQNDKHRLTWVRINCYDGLADYCSPILDKGLYVSVVGELMNRDGRHGELTEVRAHQIIFHRKDRDGNAQVDSSDEAESSVWDDEKRDQ